MCTSKCWGSCKNLSHEIANDSKESLLQIINALNNIGACTANKIDFTNNHTTNSMTEINNLKAEAKRLLDEVNGYTQWPANGAGISYMRENIFETFSFKERIKLLRQKMNSLQIPLATP